MSSDLTYGSPDPAGPAMQLTPEEIAKLPLQALLVRSGLVTLEQLSDALGENISTGRPVEEIVVSRGWVAADAVARLQWAKQGLVEPPVAPAAPAPVVPPPAPPLTSEPAPFAPPPAPPFASAPAPVAPPPVAPPPIVQTDGEHNGEHNGSASVGVFLNLADGERLWVGRFANTEAGEQRASEIIDALMRPEPGVWPRFGNRLVRPGSVVAVELSRRRDE